MAVDVERADNLDRLYALCKQKGDKEGQLKVLRAMDAMQDQVMGAQPQSTIADSAVDVAGNVLAGGVRGAGSIGATANPASVGLMARSQQSSARRERELAQLRQASSQKGAPFVRDLPEIGSAPELNEFSLKSGLASAGAMFTYGDEEVGSILTEQLGAKIGQDAEGNYFASLPSGNYAINKPGFSGQDVAKLISSIGAFTPAGKAASITGMAAGGAITQAGIEAGQSALGGEVNPDDVVVALAAPVVLGGATNLAKLAISPLKSRAPAVTQYFDDLANQADNAPPAGVSQQADELSLQPIEATRSRTPFGNLRQADIRKAVQEGTVESAGWRIDSNTGRVLPDKVGRDLLDMGVSDKVVSAPNAMTRADKIAGKRMLKKAENIIRGVKGSETDLPQSVIGESAMRRFETIKKAQIDASKRIGDAVNSPEIKGRAVNIQDVVDDFTDDLGQLGAKVGDTGKLDFSQSLIQRSNTTPLKDVYSRLRTSYDDAADLHDFKRYISKLIDYDKKPGVVRVLDDDAEAALKAVRSKVNDKLRGMSDRYARANDEFSEAAQTLVPFAKEMGRRFDPASDRVESFVGQELRKTITNYGKSEDLIIALDNLDKTARRFGGDYADDIMTQIMFNSELERTLGSFKPGSFQGRIEGAITAVRGGGEGGATERLAKAGFNAAKDRLIVKQPSKEKLELIKKLDELLSR